jgi:hypothetical protein
MSERRIECDHGKVFGLEGDAECTIDAPAPLCAGLFYADYRTAKRSAAKIT